MSKRPDSSSSPASEGSSAPASEDLVKRFRAAANDFVRLREIVESSDSASVAAAIAALLAVESSSAPSGSELPWKVMFADDVLLDALKFLGRFYLDPLLETCKRTQHLVTHHMHDVCLRYLNFATLRRHPSADECLWLRAEDECDDRRRCLELTVTKEEANEAICNVLRSAYVDRFEVCEVSLTDDLLASLKPALKMVVDQRRYLSFHDVDFKALSPSTFLDTLLGLNALRHLYLYSIRNQTFAQINDRLLLALAKSGLRDLSHSGDVNTDHVTGNLSGRGIIKFLTFDDAPRSLTVNHPRLSPSFLSELIEAVKSGRLARSDPPREVLELHFASGTLDLSTLSQYNSETDPNEQYPIWTKYFIDDKTTIRHSYCGQPYIQLFA
ncbi:hypothetical protein AAVH_12183 [Aphelenchoides avenae]|nr:hypothetical protein AAVH_12183 [Aphelenchus avenae]